MVELTKDDAGKLVAYWDEGLRHGYVDSFTKKGLIRIQPIGPKGSNPHLINIDPKDIQCLEVTTSERPTIVAAVISVDMTPTAPSTEKNITKKRRGRPKRSLQTT